MDKSALPPQQVQAAPSTRSAEQPPTPHQQDVAHITPSTPSSKHTAPAFNLGIDPVPANGNDPSSKPLIPALWRENRPTALRR